MLSQFSLLGTGTGFFLGGLFFVGKEKLFSFMGKNGEKNYLHKKFLFVWLAGKKFWQMLKKIQAPTEKYIPANSWEKTWR
jgi:hypothetical protein